MFRQLRSKIAIGSGVLMIAGALLTTILVSRNLTASMSASADRSGSAFARALALEVAGPLADHDSVAVRRYLKDAQRANPDIAYVFIAAPDGSITAHGFDGGFPADLMQLVGRDGPTTVHVEDGTVRDLSWPVAEGTFGTLHLGHSTAWVDESVYDSLTNVLVATGLALHVGVAGILLIAHLITRPMSGLVGAARRLESGDHSSSAPIIGRDEVAHLSRTFNEMASQIRARMAESEELRAYIERVLDHIESGVVVTTEEGVIDYANRVVTEAYGSVKGQKCSEALRGERPCDSCMVDDALRSGRVQRRSFTSDSGRSYELTYVPMVGHDGRKLVVETSFEVTEKQQLAQRVARAERLALAGEIAAGLVHTINNPLDGIRRALDIALRDIDNTERASAMLELAQEGVERIVTVTRTLLGFAHVERHANSVLCDVSSIVEEAVGLVQLKAESRGVSIELDLAPSLPKIEVDPHAIVEVLINLLLNAVDACGSEGKIVLQTRTADESRVQITTSDDGSGIPAEMLDQIFEPFFTTKEVGRGTGLGLSLARRIVEAHGGEIWAESAEGSGAVFRIELPGVAEEQVQEETGT